MRLTLELCLRKYPEDDIRITNIESGSIKLTIEGSQESVEKLVELIKSGELTEVNGFPVKDIQIENPLGNESDVDKWSLVQEIRRQGARNRKLISVDLSDADLRGADLRGADLSGADLSYADLSGADLSGADLSYADLSGADLSGADLSYADLSGADLSGADLFGADLSGTNFIDADLSGVYFGVIRWGRDEKSYITILERRDGESVVSIGNLGGQYQLPTKMREQQKRRAPKAVPQSAVARWSFPPWIRRFFRWLRAVER
ncbi:MAG: pentapeptide repeat-containing protein [Cyanobacteria bacterium P01_H01_bin.150]